MSTDSMQSRPWRRRRGAGILPAIPVFLALFSVTPSLPAQSPAGTTPPLSAGATCRLTIELVDAQSGAPLHGIVRIRPQAESVFLALPELVNRLAGLPAREQMRGWHCITGPATVSVPQASLLLEALSGIETGLAEAKADLAGKSAATLRIPLHRFFDPRSRNWFAGNTHLHLKDMARDEADRYLLTVPKADGLDLVFVSYLERAIVDRTYITNRYTRADLAALSGEGVLFGNGEEHRHNFGPGGEGFGHVMLLNLGKLVQPVSLGPGITHKGTDGIPLRRGIRSARSDGATVVWCHNTFGLEDIPSWATGLLHAHNIFDGGTHGSYGETFYRYLNIGLKVPFSTGTDWFIYDFSRVYVPLAGSLTVDAWLDALAAGTSLITNGPILSLEVAGRAPGAVVEAGTRPSLPVQGSALGRVDFEKIELVWNGRIVRTVASRKLSGRFEAELVHELPADHAGWAALRVTTENRNELGQPLFAHTSPVYVQVDGRGVFLPAVARELIAEMEQGIALIESQGFFADDGERNAVLEVHREGIRTLRERIAQGAPE